MAPLIRRAVARALVVSGLALGGVAIAASPASAHDEGGEAPATNYESTLLSAPDGVEVRVIDAGDRLELSLDGADEVVVAGSEGAPRYRITGRGVEENVAVTAGEANPTAEATWKRISDRPIVRWHEHRIHWMSPVPPSAVADEPDLPHVVEPRWEVALTVDGAREVALGRLDWVPPAPWWPLAIVGGGVVLALAALAARRRDAARWAAGGLVMIGTTVVSWGGFTPDPDDVGAHLVDLVAPIGWLALLGTGLWLATRAALLGWAAIGVAVIGLGLTVVSPSLDAFRYSQLPWRIDTTVARLGLVACVSGAIGLALIAVLDATRSGRTQVAGAAGGELAHEVASGPEHTGTNRARRDLGHACGLLVGAPHHLGQHERLADVG